MIGYRPPATRIIPPPPPEFADEFRKGGWRRVERIYGPRTDRILKWVEMTGAECRLPRKKGPTPPTVIAQLEDRIEAYGKDINHG